VAEFVPLFAHPRLTADAYARAVSRYFDSGIQVPIVIFADPTGREIPGTRLDHVQAQVKAGYLRSAKKALDDFRGGLPKEKVREQWADFGRGLRLRGGAKDSGAGVEVLVRLRDAAPEKSYLREAVRAYLETLDRDEAGGLVEVGKMDLKGDDPKLALDTLFGVLRDYPGLPSEGKAKALLDAAREDPAMKTHYAAAEREHRALVALRAGDRLAREGKKKEAAEAWKKVAEEFKDTPAAEEAAKRKP
jgi:hypothetical protein